MIKTIRDISPVMKNVIVRVDWNVPLKDGCSLDNSRILETIPTLVQLLNMGKHITILTHLGRPQGRFHKELSLKLLVTVAEQLLRRPIHFLEKLDSLGGQWDQPISLFENVRFFPGEETNDPTFVTQLIKNADIFVNDAFSVSHRAHASVEGITHTLPSCAGLLMERELSHLMHFYQHYQPPLIAICGGVKISTKIDFIQSMINKAETIALVGGLANTFLKAKGMNVGLSLVDDESLDLAIKIIAKAEKNGCQLWLPDYVRVGKTLGDSPIDKHVSEVKSDEYILDLAPRSCEHLLTACTKAKTVVWNGALGVFESPQWSEGTYFIAKGLGQLTHTNQIQTLVGGGETVMALRNSSTFNQFTYVSLAGGAFMEFMEGRKLPGVVPLYN